MPYAGYKPRTSIRDARDGHGLLRLHYHTAFENIDCKKTGTGRRYISRDNSLLGLSEKLKAPQLTAAKVPTLHMGLGRIDQTTIMLHYDRDFYTSAVISSSGSIDVCLLD